MSFNLNLSAFSDVCDAPSGLEILSLLPFAIVDQSDNKVTASHLESSKGGLSDVLRGRNLFRLRYALGIREYYGTGESIDRFSPVPPRSISSDIVTSPDIPIQHVEDKLSPTKFELGPGSASSIRMLFASGAFSNLAEGLHATIVRHLDKILFSHGLAYSAVFGGIVDAPDTAPSELDDSSPDDVMALAYISGWAMKHHNSEGADAADSPAPSDSESSDSSHEFHQYSD